MDNSWQKNLETRQQRYHPIFSFIIMKLYNYKFCLMENDIKFCTKKTNDIKIILIKKLTLSKLSEITLCFPMILVDLVITIKGFTYTKTDKKIQLQHKRLSFYFPLLYLILFKFHQRKETISTIDT